MFAYLGLSQQETEYPQVSPIDQFFLHPHQQNHLLQLGLNGKILSKLLPLPNLFQTRFHLSFSTVPHLSLFSVLISHIHRTFSCSLWILQPSDTLLDSPNRGWFLHTHSDVGYNLSSSRLSETPASSLTSHPSTSKVTSVSSVSPSNTVITVHKVMKDVDRRKSNVIISGLKQQPNIEDSSLVVSLFEKHFSILIKPSSVKCRRIDKPKDGSKPSRILVHLGSQNLASEILSQARQLRLSDNQDIRLNVYISRDMSPEESRLAFEERVCRRAKKSSFPSSNQENSSGGGCRDRNTTHDVPSLVPQGLPSFVPSGLSASIPTITDSSHFPPLCSHGINSIVYSGPQQLYDAHVWTPAGSSANRGPGDYQQSGYVHHPPIHSNNGGHISTIPSTSYSQ